MTFICYICEKEMVIEFKESHHEMPKAYGGEQGKEKDLCMNCHKILHKVADLIYYAKVAKVREILVSAFENREAMERLIGLAKIIVQGRLLKEEGKIKRDLEPIRGYVLPEIKKALIIISKESGVSLKDLIAHLLTEAVYARYPLLGKGFTKM